MKKFSVIIPTLNESSLIDRTINHLLNINGDLEIIISDGGSRDGTIQKLKKYPLEIVQSKMNRGVQLNDGAKKADGQILIFLHADTLLPDKALQIIEEQFAEQNLKVATFKLKFDLNHPVLKFYEWFTKFDSIFTTFGDQAIIVDRDLFFEIGQFPQMPIFEDVEFLKQVRRKTKIVKLPGSVITSARRFKAKGIFKTQLLTFYFFCLYFMKLNPQKIHKKYFGYEEQTK